MCPKQSTVYTPRVKMRRLGNCLIWALVKQKERGKLSLAPRATQHIAPSTRKVRHAVLLLCSSSRALQAKPFAFHSSSEEGRGRKHGVCLRVGRAGEHKSQAGFGVLRDHPRSHTLQHVSAVRAPFPRNVEGGSSFVVLNATG